MSDWRGITEVACSELKREAQPDADEVTYYRPCDNDSESQVMVEQASSPVLFRTIIAKSIGADVSDRERDV
jgi:hypothetical protein